MVPVKPQHTLDLVFLEFHVVIPTVGWLMVEKVNNIHLLTTVNETDLLNLNSFLFLMKYKTEILECRTWSASLTWRTVLSGSKLKFDRRPVRVFMKICMSTEARCFSVCFCKFFFVDDLKIYIVLRNSYNHSLVNGHYFILVSTNRSVPDDSWEIVLAKDFQVLSGRQLV